MVFSGQTRRALPCDLLAAERIASVCFEYPFDFDKDSQAFFEMRQGDAVLARNRGDVCFMDRYVAEQDGRLVATLCATPYVVEMDGNEARMCGIGGVCTLPTHRRSGAIRAMMNDMLNDEYQKGTEWSFLYPFSQAYYEMFGYALSEPDAVWSMSLRHIMPLKDGGYQFSLYDGDAEDISAYQCAYEGMSGYNMMVRRRLCDFTRIREANPYKTNHFAYLCRDAQGLPCGYAVWHKVVEKGQRIMEMSELIFDGLPTLLAILNFATGLASDYDRVRFHAPYCLNLESICTDSVAGKLTREVALCGMARIIHPENALRCTKLRGSGAASLLITDPANGTRHAIGLSWRDGRLNDIGKTALPPDASLDMGTFSALLLGRYDLVDCAGFHGMEIGDLCKLSGIFYRKHIHINNFF